MSVLKNLDINLLQSEKQTLRKFLFLYIFLTFVITSLGIYLYYSSQKQLYTNTQLIKLGEYANELTITLKELKNDTTNVLIYPWSKTFQTMLYDKNYKLVYATKNNPTLDLSHLQMDQFMIAKYLKK